MTDTASNRRLGVLLLTGFVLLGVSVRTAGVLRMALHATTVILWSYAGILWGQRHRGETA